MILGQQVHLITAPKLNSPSTSFEQVILSQKLLVI